MNILEALLTGFRELWSHKMQSFLTMLGVIFGVAAVISMVSIGEGAKQEAVAQIRQMGTNIIMIKRKDVAADAQDKADKKSPSGLCYGDSIFFVKSCSQIKGIVSLREVTAEVTGQGKKPITAKVLGTTPELPVITSLIIRNGRFITWDDIDRFSNVCVLGAGVKRQLFAFESALNKRVKISKKWYVCVGVLEEKAASSGRSIMQTRDQNYDVYIPFTTSVQQFAIAAPSTSMRGGGSIASFRDIISRMRVRFTLEQAPLTEIVIQVMEEEQILEVAHLLRSILMRRHREIQDYEIIIPTELLKQSQKTQRIFNVVMGAIAGISLLVGGIGIMNIMLATITQRTREIGIRRCVGATKANILIQFLMECLVITSLGGMIGVGIGIILAKGISMYAHWTTVISYTALVLAMGVSMGVGILFGLYPAWRAASIDPIRALRYE